MKKRIALIAGLMLGGCLQDSGSLESSARGFAFGLGYKVLGASCLNMDSDGDGYVSCTVRVEGVSEPLGVECASAYSLKSGCRMQRMGTLGR